MFSGPLESDCNKLFFYSSSFDPYMCVEGSMFQYFARMGNFVIWFCRVPNTGGGAVFELVLLIHKNST